MAHVAYSPVGYIYDADQYCLDCIPDVITRNRRVIYTQEDGCNCAECILDRIADDWSTDNRAVFGTAAPRLPVGFNRMDESSYDSSVFPKSIPYHNDIHAECQLEESWEPHWSCDGRCGACGDVIDGTERYLGNHEYITVCPGEDAYLDRLEQQMAEEEEDE